MEAWKDLGKGFLRTDPILKNFFGDKSDDEEIARMRKNKGGALTLRQSSSLPAPQPERPRTTTPFFTSMSPPRPAWMPSPSRIW